MSSSETQPDPRMMRVSHADRDRMVEILRDAAAEGRLEAEELEQRVEAALTARTFADFEPLTADLPTGNPPRPTPPPTAAARPADGPSADGAGGAAGGTGAGQDGAVRWAVRGLPLRREGAWSVPPVLELDIAGGRAQLDYSQARLPEGGSSLIRVRVSGGSLRLTVPAGVAVDATGVQGYGGRVRDRTGRRYLPHGAVTHVITLVGTLSGGNVKVLPTHESRHHRDRRLERRGRILELGEDSERRHLR